MANRNTWTVGTYAHDGISWVLIAGRGDRMNEADARGTLAFCETEADAVGGVVELRERGTLVAEYRSPQYRPGGTKHDLVTA